MNQDLSILVVEDDADFRRQIVQCLLPFNDVLQAGTVAAAKAHLSRRAFDVAILDKKLPDGEALQLVTLISETQSNCAILILTGDGDTSTINQYRLAGVHDYVEKTEHATLDLKLRIPAAMQIVAERRKSKALEALVADSFRYEIIGRSEPIQKLRERILILKGNRSPVLISGESGTGKELIARMLNKIEEPSRTLVIVNCGAIPEQLIESELFGYSKGAFTGAVRDTIGKFEMAHQGDLFLDEIGELPLSAQVKLLRVLQEGEVCRIGCTTPRRVSVRVIAATNRDLEAEVAAGRFRQDLYYRLNVIPLEAPTLRSRPEDIADTAQFFLTLIGKGKYRLDPSVQELFRNHSWPGNVRELRNTVERAIIEAKARQSDLIERVDVSFLARQKKLPRDYALPYVASEVSIPHFENYLKLAEHEYLKKALLFFNNNVDNLALHMGYSRSTLFRRLAQLKDLEAPGSTYSSKKGRGHAEADHYQC